MNLLVLVPAAAAAVAGIVSFAAPDASTTPPTAPSNQNDTINMINTVETVETAETVDTALGAELYATQCASCHGVGGEGMVDRGPALVGEGEGAVDFVLRTGRMPLALPNMQAKRGPVRYSETEIRALVAYAGAFGNGPPIPEVDAAAGDLATGGDLFRLNCAACHVASGAGAAIGGGREAPALMEATATQIGEAMIVGPGAMPAFGSFSRDDVNGIARYVAELREQGTTAVDDFGGAGPVAEGLAAWLLALLPLIALTRWIGTPHEGRDIPLAPAPADEEVSV